MLRVRRLVVELLLARCPDVPAVHELADELGVERQSLSVRRRAVGSASCAGCACGSAARCWAGTPSVSRGGASGDSDDAVRRQFRAVHRLWRLRPRVSDRRHPYREIDGKRLCGSGILRSSLRPAGNAARRSPRRQRWPLASQAVGDLEEIPGCARPVAAPDATRDRACRKTGPGQLSGCEHHARSSHLSYKESSYVENRGGGGHTWRKSHSRRQAQELLRQGAPGEVGRYRSRVSRKPRSTCRWPTPCLGPRSRRSSDSCARSSLRRRACWREPPTDALWLPYLGDALDAGVGTLLAEEVIVALRYLDGSRAAAGLRRASSPTRSCARWASSSSTAACPASRRSSARRRTRETAVNIVRELQKRNILTFVGSQRNGISIIDQLLEAEAWRWAGTRTSSRTGATRLSAIYPLNWAIRAALTFGGLKHGDWRRKPCCTARDRVFAFGLALGPRLDDLKYATGAGAINMGFPVIADTDIPEIRPTGICTYEHAGARAGPRQDRPDLHRGARREGQGRRRSTFRCRYSAGVRGRDASARRTCTCSSAASTRRRSSTSTWRDLDEIEDGKVELVGPDIDTVEVGAAMPLAIRVEVAGRKMQKDFEPILERQIHRFVNAGDGHHAHRPARTSSGAASARRPTRRASASKHFGTILHAKMHDEFGEIAGQGRGDDLHARRRVGRLLPEALAAFDERDERVAGMTDESVDTFYSCTLCQSFAPNHVCIISPERLGLCGAYNWLDGKAAYEINPHGPNQPIKKGAVHRRRYGRVGGRQRSSSTTTPTARRAVLRLLAAGRTR